MDINNLVSILDAKVLCGGQSLCRQIKGGYACDMLSWAMSRLQAGEAWFTILNSVNVVAVASLTECACVVLTENVEMDDDIVKRADEKGIIVLQTMLSTYEACAALSDGLKAFPPDNER